LKIEQETRLDAFPLKIIVARANWERVILNDSASIVSLKTKQLQSPPGPTFLRLRHSTSPNNIDHHKTPQLRCEHMTANSAQSFFNHSCGGSGKWCGPRPSLRYAAQFLPSIVPGRLHHARQILPCSTARKGGVTTPRNWIHVFALLCITCPIILKVNWEN
jgi:hypothetical protein